MPNLISTPRKWQSKAILIKPEAPGAYGVDTTPAAANWIEARGVSLNGIDTETAERNIELPYFGPGGKLITSTWAKLSFEIAIAGSGTAGTAPKWGPLMQGLGFAETIVANTSVNYALVTQGIGSLVAYINVDGIFYKLTGMRGDAKMKTNAKGYKALSFDFQALFNSPTGAAMPTIDRTGWLVEDAVNSVNTGVLAINGVNLAFSTYEWGLGNKIARIDLPGPQREVAITDRVPTCNATVLAPALSAFDPYALANAGATVSLSNTHGTVAGKKVKEDLKVRIIGIQEDQVEGMAAYKLSMEPTPVSGNDEIGITLL